MAVNDLLSRLQVLNNQNLVDAYVPSIDRTVKFKQLSVKQQKDLIKTGLDGASSGITLLTTINDIVTANSTETLQFNILDRTSVIIALRLQAFGTLYGDEKFDLSPLAAKQLKITTASTAVVRVGELVINMSIPDLKKDSFINVFLIEDLKKNQDIGVSDAVGSLYLYEVIKFIDCVAVGNEIIDLNTCKPQERLQIIENLPATCLNEMVQYIQQVRAPENDYLTVGGNNISVDARLFAQ